MIFNFATEPFKSERDSEFVTKLHLPFKSF